MTSLKISKKVIKDEDNKAETFAEDFVVYFVYVAIICSLIKVPKPSSLAGAFFVCLIMRSWYWRIENHKHWKRN